VIAKAHQGKIATYSGNFTITEATWTSINELEMRAVLLAIAAYSPPTHAKLHIFLDNEAARIILTKGTSTSRRLNEIATFFWHLIEMYNWSVTISRVASCDNPADGLSRGYQWSEEDDRKLSKLPQGDLGFGGGEASGGAQDAHRSQHEIH
jgi:hypothetical protein